VELSTLAVMFREVATSALLHRRDVETEGQRNRLWAIDFALKGAFGSALHWLSCANRLRAIP
jgi:hypothetical protein